MLIDLQSDPETFRETVREEIGSRRRSVVRTSAEPDLIQEGKDYSSGHVHEKADIPHETGPLMPDSILGKYASVVPLDIAEDLLEYSPDSTEFETARLKAKSEITQEILWRTGMPSELEEFLDVDVPETRELLENEFAKVLDASSGPNNQRIRDNSPVSFYNRYGRIRRHIIKSSSDKAATKQRLEDKMYIWREDLRIRIEMTEEGARPISRAEEERRGHLEAILTAENPSPELIRQIGGTLLQESVEGRASFFDQISSLTSSNPRRQRIISQLQTYVAQEFAPEVETDKI